MIELFSGIGAQERALRQLKIPYKIINTCDCDKDAVLSYAAMRFDIDSAMKTYQFSTQDKMIEELQNKGFGYDFMKGKHTITSRTPINKLKQYYIADKLSNNLGDISKVDRLPYADMVTYSFPCTDLSVAGKGEGMVNKCSCGYSWPIDFSNDSESLICPNCGAKVQSSTRSGLLGQVQRLLVVSKKENTLPKYLLLENVKNLVGKKFKPQFDAWIRWLDSIGYNTYYQVLNSKHFGIPQNRERIFALSIRKDVDNGKFKFPEQIPLTTRLKDILEKTVDEKYYLSGDKVESILANFIARQNEASGINLKDQATTFDGLTDIAHTLMARDYKGFGNQSMTGVIEPSIEVLGHYMPSGHEASRVVDADGIAPTVKENHGTVTAIVEPKIIKVGQLDSSFDQSGRVYSAEGIAPTVMSNSYGKTSGGYTSPKILVDENSDKLIKVEVPQTVNVRKYEVDIDALQKLLRDAKSKSSFTNKDIAEKLDQSLTTVEHWFRTDECFSIPSPDVWMSLKELLNITTDDFDESITTFEERLGVFEKSNRCYLENGIFPTITCGQNEKIIVSENVEPFIVASRGRNPENPSDRTTGSPTEQRLEANTNGVTNTITTVAKDNYVMEPVVCEQRCDEGLRLFKDDVVGTLRTIDACGDKRVIEPELTQIGTIDGNGHEIRRRVYDADGISPTLCGVGSGGNTEPKVLVKDDDVNPVRIGNIYGEQFGTGYAGNVWDQDSVSPTIMTAQGGNRQPLVVDDVKWRIRKLTPLECWRLMGFSDEDCNRASAYVSDSSLYKQAGNSIVTSCLVAIFYSLLFNDSSTKWSDYIVQYKINGGNE
jgi:DNA (cytosine-5)-methyltransferase 1